MNNVVLLVIAGVGTVLYMNSQNDKKGEIKEHIEPVNVDDGFYKNKPHFRVPSMPGYTHIGLRADGDERRHKPFMPPPFVGGWNNETTFHLPY